MPRFSQRQYEWRVMVALVFYSGFMLLAWPLVRTTSSYPLKVLFALVPCVPVIYMLSQMARRIRTSDEFEQRVHLIALALAMGVVGVLSLVGGFLSIAGVLKLDGSILIWVFPVMMFSYSAARWQLLRRYGASTSCDDGTSIWLWFRFVLLGVVLLAIALMSRSSLDEYRLGFIYGTGIGFIVVGFALLLGRWYRSRFPHD
jgi:hypothetical protein